MVFSRRAWRRMYVSDTRRTLVTRMRESEQDVPAIVAMVRRLNPGAGPVVLRVRALGMWCALIGALAPTARMVRVVEREVGR